MACFQTHTGRLVVTSQAHLQAVTALAVDPTSNFLLSGSADSSIHVWSIPSLLSFSNQDTHSPLHTLSGHRSAITALSIGHSTSSYNIVVSASKDNTAIVWDYHSPTLLRTILLPATPLCLAMDPADRAVYTGYEDGSVQLLSFYSSAFSASAVDETLDTTRNPLHDDTQTTLPVQPLASTRWTPPSQELGATLSCTLSYDGTTLTTGHASGKIIFWDVPLARYSSTYGPTNSPLPGPVTNLTSLPILGFPSDIDPKRTKLHAVVKPKHGAFEARDVESAVPGDYKLTGQFTTSIPLPHFSATEISSQRSESSFITALSHPSFPADLLTASLAEFGNWTPNQFGAQPASADKEQVPAAVAQQKADGDQGAKGDYVSLDAKTQSTGAGKEPTLEEKNKQLQAEIAALRKAQRTSLREMEDLKKKFAKK